MFRRASNFVVSVAVLTSLAGPAIAQGQSSDVVSLEKVVVQAQRQDQAGQDVPVSLTAITGDELRQSHISSNQDLLARVPSLSVSSNNQTRSTAAFTLRGQGTTYQASQGVVLYVAETPVLSGFTFSTQGGPGQFLDLDSLQVLKGPQGTLFGRNAVGGAVLLAPTRPKDRFEGYWQAQVGNFADREVEGVVNVPLADKVLLIRAAVQAVDRAGFTKNLVGPALDDKRYWTGRIGITFRPIQGVENYFMGFNTSQRNRGDGRVIEGVNPALGFGPFQSLVNDQGARGPRAVRADTDPHDVLRTFGAVDILSVDLGNDVKLRNIASYSVLRHSMRYNFDGLGPLPGINEIATFTNASGQYQDNIRQETEELQIQGRSSVRSFNFVLGVYADRSRPAGPNQALSVGRGLGIIREDRQYGVSRSSRAVYAQSNATLERVAPWLQGVEVTGGVRYTWDRTHGFQDDGVVQVAQPGIERCGSNPSLLRPNCLITAALQSEAPSWLLGLTWRAAENSLLYAKLSKGYKAGGVNASAVNLNSLTYGPERAKALEAGVKSDFRLGDVPFRANADIYKTDYADIQRAAIDYSPANNAFGAKTVNAASARIKGFEAEIAVRPHRGLELSANYSHTDARYRSFSAPALAQIDCTGSFVGSLVPGAAPRADLTCIPFPFVAKNQYAVSVRQSIHLPSGAGEVDFGATYAHQSSQYMGWTSVPGDEPGSYLGPIGLLTLTLDWRRASNSPWDLHLFCTNALNKTYRIGNSGVYDTLGFQNSIYGEPRMLGIQLRYRFGDSI